MKHDNEKALKILFARCAALETALITGQILDKDARYYAQVEIEILSNAIEVLGDSRKVETILNTNYCTAN